VISAIEMQTESETGIELALPLLGFISQIGSHMGEDRCFHRGTRQSRLTTLPTWPRNSLADLAARTPPTDAVTGAIGESRWELKPRYEIEATIGL
ncbi:MAG: hypothetical protein ACFFD9_09285, partial [Candidatus Thorarchaeota archaeon]